MKNFLYILLIILIMTGVWLLGTHVMPKVLSKQYGFNIPVSLNASEILPKEVNNLGYTFYLGEIDNSNSLINDTFKNEITKIIYDAKFPKSLLKNVSIVVVNSLALKPDQYIKVQNINLKVIDFGSGFLYEGGVDVQYLNSDKNVIYINKDFLVNGKMSLQEILTHELGHVIENKLTAEDWKKYYSLRSIPTKTELNKDGRLWNLSPREDFAEVYKNIYTNTDVKTFYGYLKSTWELGLTCGNQGSQSCKIKVLSNPEKYPNDFVVGAPYKSIVDQKTKDFIKDILSKL